VTTVLAFLLLIGVLIFVHELGHFLVARWYGVRVLTFSLGFGPKMLKVNRGGTEYCVSAIPLGGYVKMAGEHAQDERVGAPDEFLSKSKWVRFQVYLAGPVMNVVLAIVALTVVNVGGADVAKWVTSPPVVGSLAENGAAARAGLMPGDLILSVNGREVKSWDELQLEVLPKAGRQLALVIDRQGSRRTVTVTPAAETRYELGTLGIGPVFRPQILVVRAGMPAERVGLRRGDVLVSVAGQRGVSREQAIALIRSQGPAPIVLGIERDGQALEVTVTPEGKPGSSVVGMDIAAAEFRRVDLSLPQAFSMSLRQNWENAFLISRGLKALVTGEAPVRQLMGPLAIADLSGSAAEMGVLALLSFMAMISLNLALLNLCSPCRCSTEDRSRYWPSRASPAATSAAAPRSASPWSARR
jgi:regulator of sigma E protease